MTFLASDARNPEFMGAHDPDARLAVQFYERPIQNEYQSGIQQRPIFENVVFIKIITPGDKLNIIDTIARQDHKDRFPRQWSAFQQRKDASSQFVGTPIGEWPRVSASQAEELKALKFYTVESVANASDAQLQGIGMIAGTSAFTFRDEAKRFLMVADAAAKLSEADRAKKEADEQLAAAKAEILRQQEQHAKDMEEMRAEMKRFMEMAAKENLARKTGRPAKEQEGA